MRLSSLSIFGFLLLGACGTATSSDEEQQGSPSAVSEEGSWTVTLAGETRTGTGTTAYAEKSSSGTFDGVIALRSSEKPQPYLSVTINSAEPTLKAGAKFSCQRRNEVADEFVRTSVLVQKWLNGHDYTTDTGSNSGSCTVEVSSVNDGRVSLHIAGEIIDQSDTSHPTRDFSATIDARLAQ